MDIYEEIKLTVEIQQCAIDLLVATRKPSAEMDLDELSKMVDTFRASLDRLSLQRALAVGSAGNSLA